MSDKNNNKTKAQNEQMKEDLLRELSMDLGDTQPQNQKNKNGIKNPLSNIPETSIEISCIEPLKGQKDRFDRNEDSTVPSDSCIR